jgi:hypothetical protein
MSPSKRELLTILLEKNRTLLLRTVQQFLEEPAPAPAATQ